MGVIRIVVGDEIFCKHDSCQWCKKTFIVKRADAKFCSPKCRNAMNRFKSNNEYENGGELANADVTPQIEIVGCNKENGEYFVRFSNDDSIYKFRFSKDGSIYKFDPFFSFLVKVEYKKPLEKPELDDKNFDRIRRLYNELYNK